MSVPAESDVVVPGFTEREQRIGNQDAVTDAFTFPKACSFAAGSVYDAAHRHLRNKAAAAYI
jgi:hypothetical protein